MVAKDIEDDARTRIYLIGAGGTGKTTLANSYVAKEARRRDARKIDEVARPLMKELGVSQGDLRDDGLFWDLQMRIAKRQMEEERKEGPSGGKRGVVVSDRSVIDALVYALTRFPDGLPMSDGSPKLFNEKDIVTNGLVALVGDRETTAEVVRHYKRSLVVLVNPFDGNDAIDDKVRLVMSRKELDEFTAKCREVLDQLEIGFLDLKETNPSSRLDALKRHEMNLVATTIKGAKDYFA